ncbi:MULTISPECIES: hypothetical protein [Paraburkholderia]|uniref:hypothetical protein n=1 Tax=Paraburkholderia TaxID=1822464 RepID=UPI00160A620D|nr:MULTISPECIES: hypothetical protein [Paraburkholderia]MBB3259799.1 hypothetical protein [Paraburkholderia sp. WP4_3_2]
MTDEPNRPVFPEERPILTFSKAPSIIAAAQAKLGEIGQPINSRWPIRTDTWSPVCEWGYFEIDMSNQGHVMIFAGCIPLYRERHASGAAVFVAREQRVTAAAIALAGIAQ